MQEAIEKPKESLSPHATRLLSFRIDPELNGTIIGHGGRTIKGITERTNNSNLILNLSKKIITSLHINLI